MHVSQSSRAWRKIEPFKSCDGASKQWCRTRRLCTVRQPHVTTVAPLQSRVTDTGTLHPGEYWYPKWMKYRQRPDNYFFWTQKFLSNSLQIPDEEKRWTVLSTIWWAVKWWKFYMIPAWVRFFFSVIYRAAMVQAYNMHKALVLQQAKVDVYLMQKYHGQSKGAFSKAMALRRLHMKNSLLAEALYYVNLIKTGRVHMLPPVRQPAKRPSLFIFF